MRRRLLAGQLRTGLTRVTGHILFTESKIYIGYKAEGEAETFYTGMFIEAKCKIYGESISSIEIL